MLILNTDGGSRGNPGQAAIAFIIRNEKGDVMKSGGKIIGIATNNIAEYEALILGLNELLKTEERIVECRLDSELVVRQLNRKYKVKDAKMIDLFAKVTALLGKFENVKFVHVPRGENEDADRIVNEVLDVVVT